MSCKYVLEREGADYVLRNLTWSRTPWRGSIDCPIWDWISPEERKALAGQRLKDARASQLARPGKSSDRQSYLKLMRAMVR